LSQAERRANVAGAFAWQGRPAPAGLALVDDVLTTGATLEAAEAAVVAAGGQVAAVLVLAVREGAGSALAQTFPVSAVTSRREDCARRKA
jgi:orotate phosphoribosyltransferase